MRYTLLKSDCKGMAFLLKYKGIKKNNEKNVNCLLLAMRTLQLETWSS